jgi:hypothetical protein
VVLPYVGFPTFDTSRITPPLGRLTRVVSSLWLVTVLHERYRSCAYSFCQTDAGSVGHTAKEAGNPGEVEPGTASAIGAALVRATLADSVPAPTLLARQAGQPGVAHPQGGGAAGPRGRRCRMTTGRWRSSQPNGRDQPDAAEDEDAKAG